MSTAPTAHTEKTVAMSAEQYKNVIYSCSRCWHNHIPGSGTICMCMCHSPASPFSRQVK